MPQLSERAWVVLGVWIAFLGACLFTFGGKDFDTVGSVITSIVLGVVYAGVAMGATAVISEKWRDSAAVPLRDVQAESRGKAKRSDMALIERLVESLSPEEMTALRERLGVPDDSEISSDGELRQARTNRR